MSTYTDDEMRNARQKIADYIIEAERSVQEAEFVADKFGIGFSWDLAYGMGGWYESGSWYSSSQDC